ncbi:MAG: YccF domain-containing protein [Bacteroidales bacterium]|nr:YccF domain-containing protein [Bacteroidales bacterium]MBR2856001.1 YccF domain-containing protein [Bacteroidales bacterium]
MKLIGNVIWTLFGGFIVVIYYFVVGLLFCLTIVGIPFGLQLMKMAGFALWPFGREILPGPKDSGCLSVVMNVIWILLGGVEIALIHLILGVVFCVTLIGIPFGLQHFKMAYLALVPFGKIVA